MKPFSQLEFRFKGIPLGLTGFKQILFPSSCVGCRSPLEATNDQTSLIDGAGIAGLDRNSQCQPTLLSVADSNSVRRNHKESTSTLIPGTANHAFIDWQNSYWCRRCWDSLRERAKYQCVCCGAYLPKRSPLKKGCINCHKHKLAFSKAFAIGNYDGPLRELVIRMKNLKDDVIAIHLGKLLGFELLGVGWKDFDQIVPVPIHWTRRLTRNFQATEILAEQIGLVTSMPVNGALVQSIRRTAKQGTLSGSGRKSNVRNAFGVAAKADIQGRRILLVDDVLTTGATTSEISRILTQRGAAEVCVAVVARATGIG